MQDRIIRQFNDAIDVTIRSIEPLLPTIESASNLLVQALLGEHKVLACGNGVSASTANQFTTCLVDQFRHERPGLPALSLAADSATWSAIAIDYHFNEIFSRQVRALGQPGDVLLAATHKPGTPNLAHAIRAAHERDMGVILLGSTETADLNELLGERDILLCVPSETRARIQEIHLLITHCLCDLVEYQLFGSMETEPRAR